MGARLKFWRRSRVPKNGSRDEAVTISPYCTGYHQQHSGGVSPFLVWGDFHARSRFARSTIPKDKWGTTRSLNMLNVGFKFWQVDNELLARIPRGEGCGDT